MDDEKVRDEEEAAFEDGVENIAVPPPLKPKDPRSKYKYNLLFRIFFL